MMDFDRPADIMGGAPDRRFRGSPLVLPSGPIAVSTPTGTTFVTPTPREVTMTLETERKPNRESSVAVAEPAGAPEPSSQPEKPREREVREAVERVYRSYGSDLAAFQRDILNDLSKLATTRPRTAV